MALDKDKLILGSQERTCPECERKFIITSQWAYKLDVKGKTMWYCRYNCVRAAGRKLESEKAGRKKTMKSKKPSKEKLEDHLRAGATIASIAKKYDASTQSVNNWIKAYRLIGIQGKKKDKEPESTPLSRQSMMPPTTSGVEVTTQEERQVIYQSPPCSLMAHATPTLSDIEQFHTDAPVQALPKVEIDQVLVVDVKFGPDPTRGIDVSKVEDFYTPSATSEAPPVNTPQSVTSPDPVPTLRRNFEEVWQDTEDDITQLRIMYDQQADDDFRDRLFKLVLAVTRGKGLVG
ncbi:helix-turn-helix domain-containing protein [Desulfosporosinus fructosivorans]|uniref:Helix-turn-helix domain-containing protein n=1 Tax=Desulfosporosinus fructosivorans TaxID=2018669 RepID=A0A4Z0QZM8_9FIRM|nr:helix-turn-helix domain-containing protein [Desulfosporosinus fructosivorans]TGE35914.1 helix-turn-helix domain-containing protein [Desulfosporosinus fructosivorans]